MQAFLYAKRLAHIINLRPVPLSFNILQKYTGDIDAHIDISV